MKRSKDLKEIKSDFDNLSWLGTQEQMLRNNVGQVFIKNNVISILSELNKLFSLIQYYYFSNLKFEKYEKKVKKIFSKINKYFYKIEKSKNNKNLFRVLNGWYDQYLELFKFLEKEILSINRIEKSKVIIKPIIVDLRNKSKVKFDHFGKVFKNETHKAFEYPAISYIQMTLVTDAVIILNELGILSKSQYTAMLMHFVRGKSVFIQSFINDNIVEDFEDLIYNYFKTYPIYFETVTEKIFKEWKYLKKGATFYMHKI